jgi:protein SERAC1
LFFGTPHKGSAKAGLLLSLQRVTSRIFPRVFGRVEKSLVKALQVESETVQNITDHFTPIMKNFHIHFFWEQEKTNLRYCRSYIVEEDSAAPIYDDTERSGIYADHSRMVKFDESTSSSFRLVVETLQRYSETATEVIKQRLVNSEQRAEGKEPQSPSKLSRRTTYLPSYKHPLPLTQHAADYEETPVNLDHITTDLQRISY